jgi:hypothetical protein
MGLIPYKLSRTNREYRRMIHRAAPAFSPVAHDFLPFMDDILYGGSRADADDYAKYKSIVISVFKR